MSSFTSPLIVEFLGAGRWRLAEPFEYHLGELGSGTVIRVPAGFQTDFASVPRLLWPLLPPTGSYGKAAVLHDYLYATQQIDGQPSPGPGPTRSSSRPWPCSGWPGSNATPSTGA